MNDQYERADSALLRQGSGRGALRATSYVDGAGRKRRGSSYWSAQAAELRAAYEARREADRQALEAAEQFSRESAAARQEALGREYRGTNRQLYRDYMQQQRALPQQLAAQGYTGGLTESSLLRLGNAYGEALNDNERERIGRQAENDQVLAQQLYDARAAAAAADSQALQDYYSQRRELSARRQSELERRAAALAAQGDFRLYRKLGYTDREIRYLERMFRRQHPELFKSPGGGSGRGGRRGAAAAVSDPGGDTGTGEGFRASLPGGPGTRVRQTR